MAQCRLCHGTLPVKQRRTIFTDTFTVRDQLVEVLGYIPKEDDGLSRYVCGYCFTKLNRLSKIEYDLSHRMEALNNERFCVLKDLRERFIAQSANVASAFPPAQHLPSTPKSVEKRTIIHSPTPRKIKKNLTFTPRKTSERLILGQPDVQKPTGDDKTGHESDGKKRKQIHVSLFSPGKAKVLYRARADTKVKSAVVPAGIFQRIVRNITNKGPYDRIARLVYSSPLKQSIQQCILKELGKESAALCSTKSSLSLRNLSPESLSKFSFTDLRTELLSQGPLTYEVINQIVKKSSLGISVTAAVALKFRNQQMSALHHVVAQILDHGGATDETISILNKLGLCVSTPSTNNMKNNLLERQMNHTQMLMLEEKKELEHPTVHISNFL